jgi:Sec-independent protein translocase protein TatA
MDLFNISAVELIVLVFLGGVVLGPRRLAKLGRDAGKTIRQIRALTGDLTKQLNLEIDLLEAAEGKPPEGTRQASRLRSEGKPSQAPKSDGKEAPLPEAYRRFRKDFPDEGKLDSPASQPAPAATSATAPSGEGQPRLAPDSDHRELADVSEPQAAKTPQARSQK